MVDFAKHLKENRMKTKEAEKTATATAPPVAAQVPAVKDTNTGVAVRQSFINPEDATGTENIGIKDVKFPVLRIAQGLSSQLIEGDSTYIPTLKMFDMFNDLTNEVYGKGPLRFVPIMKKTAWVEFDPNERGKVLDRNVPVGDPRTVWSKDADGKDVPPRATHYEDFVIILVHGDGRPPEPVVLSIKCTNKWQSRAAERLNSQIKFQRGPIYSAYKQVCSKPEKNDEGTFGVFVIDNVMRLDAPGQTDEQWDASMELFRYCEQFYAGIKDKNVVVDREPGSDDGPAEAGAGAGDASFDPAEFEKGGAPKM